MKDQALQLAAGKDELTQKLNILREYLQAYVLRTLFDMGFFRENVFVGGTALRFLYDLPRYSEDLDFSVIGKGKGSNFAGLIKKLKQELVLAGYNVTLVYNDTKTVQSSFIKFNDLMRDAGISRQKNQILSVKLEVDTHPPSGAGTKTCIVNRYFPVSFLSYDIESLFSRKIHALLNRRYTKGRDLFDLGWYMSKWKNITPNITFLNSALKQTGWKGESPTKNNWRLLVARVVEMTDWKKVHNDVDCFLENTKDMNVFSKEALLDMLRSGT